LLRVVVLVFLDELNLKCLQNVRKAWRILHQALYINTILELLLTIEQCICEVSNSKLELAIIRKKFSVHCMGVYAYTFKWREKSDV